MRLILTLATMLVALPAYAQTASDILEILNTTDVAPVELMKPSAVAVDADGNVYVAATLSNNAFQITPSGTVNVIIDSLGDGGGNPLLSPTDIAVDAAGNVYVAGLVSNNVFKIPPGGPPSQIIDGTGVPGNPAIVLNGPSAIDVDSSSNVYVAGSLTHNAFKITPSGTVTELISTTGDGIHALLVPLSIAVGPNGNVYVSGSTSNNVFEITPDATITEIIDIGPLIGPPGRLETPREVVVDADGNVYVTGQFSNNAFRITPDGTIDEIIDETGGELANPLGAPLHIAVDLSGNVFLTGTDTDNAFTIDTPDGCSVAGTPCTITEIIDETGDGMAAVDAPLGIAVGDDGSVFITGSDSDNVFVPEPGAAILQLISVLVLVGLRRMRRSAC